VILRRFFNAFGQMPVLVETGETFTAREQLAVKGGDHD
jgi:hypothetical protein